MSWESLKIWSTLTSNSAAIFSPAINASYSSLLLVTVKLNLMTYSTSDPSGLVRTRPAPPPCPSDDPSMCKVQQGDGLGGTANSAHSTRKSAKACPLIVGLG
ncbi:hypothetical protein Dimus_037969 [Dionaea muscipula]